MIKKLVNNYFVMIALAVTGIAVFAWTYVLTMHPFIILLIILIIVGSLIVKKKSKRN